MNNEDIWSSDPQSGEFPVITVFFKNGIFITLHYYKLKSGFEGRNHSPYLRNWKLFGRSGNE
jgi:hypothetical protein